MYVLIVRFVKVVFVNYKRVDAVAVCFWTEYRAQKTREGRLAAGRRTGYSDYE